MKYPRLILIGSGLVLGFAANAQTEGRGYFQYPQRDDPYYRSDRNRSDDGDYYRQRGDYRDSERYSTNRYGYGPSGSLIGEVLRDIDRAASNAWVDSHERKHFDEAAQKLQEFEDRWAQGNFDKGKLDKAIENLQHLADADQVRGRDRDILSRDLAELRQFRSTRGRYVNGGYRDYRDDRYHGR